jgi:hypothetical protein
VALEYLNPTSTAPYAARVVEMPLRTGSFAIDYRYTLARRGYAYQVTRFNDERAWQHVGTGTVDWRTLPARSEVVGHAMSVIRKYQEESDE